MISSVRYDIIIYVLNIIELCLSPDVNVFFIEVNIHV